MRNIKAEKALIEKNQLSATKSDGTPYRFLDTKLRKYLELKQQEQELENAENKMRAGTVVEKDQIARTLFSNLKIDNQNKLTYLLNPELNGLIKTKKCNSGEPGGTRSFMTEFRFLCNSVRNW